MDGSQFDAISRTVTLARSRRQALTGALAGALGLMRVVDEPAAAKKKKTCGAGLTTCKIKKGKKKKTRCIDTTLDPSNCGRCGNRCPNGQVCRMGSCGTVQPPLPPPPTPCVPTSCPADICGSVPDGCDGTITCGCPAGQVCVGSTCQPCTMVGDVCKPCIMVDGICEPCTVTCANPQTCRDELQAALDQGGTVYVCPGRYPTQLTVNTAVTVIGAGDGADEASNSIFVGGSEVLRIGHNVGTVALTRLRFTGVSLEGSAAITHLGTMLRMTDCTVAGNTAPNGTVGAGILVYVDATLEMLRCTIRDNHAIGTEQYPTAGAGGGLFSYDGTATLTDCLVADNSAMGRGGGIVIAGGSLTLAGNTQVRDNTAPQGGGISIGAGTLEIEESCRVTRNRAAAFGDGGGILRVGGTVTLQGEDPSPIVINNCFDNCAGSVEKCAALPVLCM